MGNLFDTEKYFLENGRRIIESLGNTLIKEYERKEPGRQESAVFFDLHHIAEVRAPAEDDGSCLPFLTAEMLCAAEVLGNPCDQRHLPGKVQLSSGSMIVTSHGSRSEEVEPVILLQQTYQVKDSSLSDPDSENISVEAGVMYRERDGGLAGHSVAFVRQSPRNDIRREERIIAPYLSPLHLNPVPLSVPLGTLDKHGTYKYYLELTGHPDSNGNGEYTRFALRKGFRDEEEHHLGVFPSEVSTPEEIEDLFRTIFQKWMMRGGIMSLE